MNNHKYLYLMPGSPEWHAARRGKITGTSAANIVVGGEGGDSYRSPLQEFQRMKRELAGETDISADLEDSDDVDDEEGQLLDIDQEQRFRWGLDSERLHLQYLQEETGWKIEGSHAIVADDEFDWLCTSMDAWRTDASDVDIGPVELKAPTGFGLNKWGGQVPMQYVVQNMIQMRCTNLKWGCVSAFVPPGVSYYETNYNQDTMDWVMGKLIKFHDDLMADKPPPAFPTDADLKALRQLANVIPGKVVFLGDAAAAASAEREEIVADIRAKKKRKKELDLILIEEFDDAELGVLPSGAGYTFKGKEYPVEAKPPKIVKVPPSLRYIKRAL